MDKIEKVLLFDDDPTMRTLLETLLSMEGFNVFSYVERKGDDFISFLKSNTPDALLLDVNLTYFNGIDLLKMIKADEQLSNIRVLMTSGMDVKNSCLNSGADGFLLKPYMPDELIKWLRETKKN